MSETQRCACGETIGPDDLRWPCEGDEEICQDCWEAYCDREWAAMVTGQGVWWQTAALDRLAVEGEALGL